MWGSRDLWSTVLDAPVFSYCNHGDIACQGGTEDIPVDGDFQPIDTVGMMYWSERRHGDPLAWMAEHAEYMFSGDGASAAYDVADALQIPFAGRDEPALDVVFLIDSTEKMDAAIDEIQGRIDEWTDQIDDANENHRYAVVQFKGHGSGNTITTDVVHDFTDDPSDIADAIDSLYASGGTAVPLGYAPQAAGYSGVLAAAGMDWRGPARKVILLVSGNRVGDADPMGTESGSAHTNAEVVGALRQAGARMYSVSWSDNFYNGLWESPLSAASTRIAENQSVVTKGLEYLDRAVLEVHPEVSGPLLMTAGETIEFTAESTRSVVTGEELAYHWGCSEAQIGGGDSRRSSPQGTCGTSMADDEDPDEGVRQSFEFATPGDYDITVRVVPEGPLGTAASDSLRVHVRPVADNVPPTARERLTYANSVLTIAVTPGSGAGDEAELWALQDANGDDQALYVLPGEPFELEVEGLTEPETVGWRLVPRNAEGDTEPAIETTVGASTYIFRTNSDDGPLGGTLNVQGEVTEELAAVRDAHVGSGPIEIAGDYSAEFLTDAGAVVPFSMTSATGTVDLGATDWELSLDLGDHLNSFGYPMWQTMQSGLVSELFDAGGMTVQFDSQPFYLRFDESSVTELVNAGVLDPIASPPDGLPVSVTSADSSAQTILMQFDGTIDDDLFPAVSEIADPETFDWGTAVVQDVRVYVGTKEYENWGELRLLHVDPTLGVIQAEFVGTVGWGSTSTMREFLQSGVISAL
jgi:hypothetical protein